MSPYRRSARIGARRLLMAVGAATCILAGPAAVSAAAQAPVNNLAPEVVGTALVGERLVCAAGSWTGPVSKFEYEWLRDSIPVSSNLAYQVTTADKGHSLSCVVTAISGEGNVEAESANSVFIPGGKVEPPVRPENISPPEVSGQPAVGERLNCSAGTWSGSPTFSYQWLRDGSNIVLATSGTYTVVGADQGHSLSCRVVATNGAGSASKPSSNSLLVPGAVPKDTLAPQVLGINPSRVGESLTCSPGTWNGSPVPTFAYQWVRDSGLPGESIVPSATGSIYTVEPADQLHSLSCVVTATNSLGSAEAVSSNSLTVAGSKPENITAPEVSGTPAVGETLTCETGTWTGVPTPTFKYLWVRDQGMLGEVAIGSATSSTYTAGVEDGGQSLTCEVTASNSEGSASLASQRVVIPAGTGGTPPENTEAPEVAGTAALGETLTCSEGAWSGSPAPTVTYQWLRDGSPIASATSGTHSVVEADLGHSLSCRVSAINEEGVSFRDSNARQIPGRRPESIEAPQVSGTPSIGQSLTCLRGRWNGKPAPTFSYQWLRSGADIPSATASSYTVANEDRGRSISCTVTAENSAGTVEAASSNSLQILGGQPQNTEPPEVSGISAVGQTVTCSQGTWNGQPTPTYAYQWLLNGIEIPSVTTNSYTVRNADRGYVLSCRVTASNREGTESAASRGLHIPGLKPEDIEAPSVSGTPTVGQTLTCLRGIWNGAPPPTFTYQWLRDGVSIASATSSTYSVALADQGHLLSCDVNATNTEGSAEAESSSGVAILRKAVITEAPPPELMFSPPAKVVPAPTTAKILAGLGAQLVRAQRGARITTLRKTGLYTFSFAALAAGKLEFSWYQAPTGALHGAANTKPPVLALSTTSFAGAGKKTVKLRLTTAGRRLIGLGVPVKLTVKAVFVRPHAKTVTWLETVMLNR